LDSLGFSTKAATSSQDGLSNLAIFAEGAQLGRRCPMDFAAFEFHGKRRAGGVSLRLNSLELSTKAATSSQDGLPNAAIFAEGAQLCRRCPMDFAAFEFQGQVAKQWRAGGVSLRLNSLELSTKVATSSQDGLSNLAILAEGANFAVLVTQRGPIRWRRAQPWESVKTECSLEFGHLRRRRPTLPHL